MAESKLVGSNATVLLGLGMCVLRTILTMLGALWRRPVWISTSSAIHVSSAAVAETSR